MLVAGATGGFFWLPDRIPVILYHRSIDSALLQWARLIFYCSRFLFPFLKFLFYFVLHCFHSFAVNKNIWQTASLRMIYQPNHLGHWNIITCKIALDLHAENCMLFSSLLCGYISMDLSWVEKSVERGVGLYFKSIVVVTFQIIAFTRPTISLAITFHIKLLLYV